MSLHPWWQEITDHMLYHVGDQAYQRHHTRVEIERNLRELVQSHGVQTYLQAEAARAQIAVVQNGFDQLGFAVNDLQESIGWALESVGGAIHELEETLSWDMAEIKWQQEQTNQLLQDALKTFRHPWRTQAEELRERGNEFFSNALSSRRQEDRQRWMDLALEAFKEAAQYNTADFSIFHSMGVILFFEKGSSEDALKCFREAAALAEPYSRHHAATSWLYLAYVHRNRQEIEEAYEATTEALILEPGWHEFRYYHAVSCVLTGRFEEGARNLEEVIRADDTYFAKAAADPEFISFPLVRKTLNGLLLGARQKAVELRNSLLDLLSTGSEISMLRSDDALARLGEAQGYTDLIRSIRTGNETLEKLLLSSPTSQRRYFNHQEMQALRVRLYGGDASLSVQHLLDLQEWIISQHWTVGLSEVREALEERLRRLRSRLGLET